MERVELVRPLYTKELFKLGKIIQCCFQKVKKLVANTLICNFSDYVQIFEIQVNNIQYILGAILVQHNCPITMIMRSCQANRLGALSLKDVCRFLWA